MTKMNRNNYQRRNAKIIAARFSRSNPGVEMLSKAADQQVHDKSTKIAEALTKEALSGNASATRLLVDLAELEADLAEPGGIERTDRMSSLGRWATGSAARPPAAAPASGAEPRPALMPGYASRRTRSVTAGIDNPTRRPSSA